MTTTTIQSPVEIQPYATFHVEVARTQRLSPNFVRVTFTGDCLAHFADHGHDQRVKLVVPLPGRGLADFPGGPDWYARWRTLPDERRNPLRTYTVRAVRADLREVDIDFALHGDGGPASRWASAAAPAPAWRSSAPTPATPAPIPAARSGRPGGRHPAAARRR